MNVMVRAILAGDDLVETAKRDELRRMLAERAYLCQTSGADLTENDAVMVRLVKGRVQSRILVSGAVYDAARREYEAIRDELDAVMVVTDGRTLAG
ncbi:hypothetical protein ACIA8K_12750 [Catenuloplanes sp. NPDC051500]|uniref:hypothetical protein n=1 Tax=Catenuloplanes sp. NPDC051500 TaxID=3363959 RepID=UPI0037AF4F22